MKTITTLIGLAIVLTGCVKNSEQASQTEDDMSLKLFTLKGASGMTVTITNFGGKVVSLLVPDRSGNFADVVLGYDSVTQYPQGNPYFGALIGRYGNRIANGNFILGNDTFKLATNNGANALHGGPNGFHNVLWSAKQEDVDGHDALKLTYISEDGEEGYPGKLTATVTYLVNDNNELIIDYVAVTTRETVVNLTHHSFFNLKGEGSGDILDHSFELFADQYLPVDAGLIPIGAPAPVTETPFDFMNPHAAGERISIENEQLKRGNGYDHCWVLNKKTPGELSLAARVSEPSSGRIMEVFTTEPGLQFYSGNFLSGRDIGKGGKPYEFRSAFCLEAQHYPDSPNKPDYPSTVLKPGQTYRQRTIYRFGVR
ncbi:MAG: galactose mutarotase [Bacteroidetes bacterium]|nr:galactose mutarotase [Bacteroidota bacterium]